MPSYMLGPHGIVHDWTPEMVRAAGYDPVYAEIYTQVRNPAQFGTQVFDWSGYGLGMDPQAGVDWVAADALKRLDYATGYIPQLLDWRAKAQAGTLSDLERWQYEQWVRDAQKIPMRDVSTLTWDPAQSGFASAYLSGESPDLGNLMLTIADKMDRGTATAQEVQLFQTAERALREQDYRASVPQASDSPFGWGDNLFGALMTIGIGASMGSAAPLMSGTVTLPALAGAAATAGGMTSMAGEALDENALRQAGMALSAAGAATGATSLLSSGINTWQDAVKLAQKVYSTYSKASSAASVGSTPSADTARTGTTSSPASLSQAQRSTGTTSQSQSSSKTGGNSMAQPSTIEDISTVLTGLVGLAGAGLSLNDVRRYMDQLKERYGDQQEIKDLIDQAYQLALASYNTHLGDTRLQQQQNQEAYQTARARYDTYYTQTQQEQAQRQQTFATQQAQLGEDRQRAIQSYEERVRQAAEDREREINVFGQDRQLALQSYNTRVQEAAQDRDRAIARDEQRVREAAEERGLDMRAYEARQAIGRNLSDPAAMKAGAEALYQPLSDLARERISRNTQAEMGMRGVTGGGMYANRLSAEAFAPEETKLWQTALNAYLQGQTGAINAYANMDLAGTPEYIQRYGTPEYRRMNVPDFATTPAYTGTTAPRVGVGDVPGTVAYVAPPRVPEAVAPPNALKVDPWTAEPYQPFGTTRETGSTVLGETGTLLGNLTRLLGGNTGILAKLLPSLLGGRTWEQLTNAEQTQLQNDIITSMGNNPDLFALDTNNPYDTLPNYTDVPDWSIATTDWTNPYTGDIPGW